VAFFDTEPTTYTQSWPLRIPAGRKAIVNVGSVGQPRDGNPDAAYAIYDTEKRLVYLHRVPYNVEETSRKILAAGLPSILAERLHFGM
jgi:diadenosine tetraphosphatase ApaH/serine/threonine PP2A family protein phosphatase